MLYLRAAIFTVSVLLVALMGFILYTYDEKYELRNAMEYFLKGDSEKSEKILNKLERSIPASQYNLYQAYIARSQNDLGKSNAFLIEAEKSAESSVEPLLAQEIYLNQAYNGYKMRDPKVIGNALSALSSIKGNDAQWVVFFQGVEAFLQERYAQALKNWQTPLNLVPLSPWMEKAFDKSFTNSWLTLHIARSDIEEGRYLNARETLEKIAEQSSHEDLQEVNFLIGLTYVKEAEEKTRGSSIPYWKMAFSYFDRIPIQSPKYSKDRERIIRTLNKNAMHLIDTQDLEPLSFYINTLEKWQAHSELEGVAFKLTEYIKEQISQANLQDSQDLANFLNRIIPTGDARETIRSIFEAELDRSIASGNSDNLKKYWESTRMLSVNPGHLKQKTLKKIEQKILLDEKNKSSDIRNIETLLSFWNFLQTSPQAKQQFETYYIQAAFKVWEDGDPRQGLKLLKVILDVTDTTEAPVITAQINSKIKKLYMEALQRNSVEELSIFIDVASALNLPGLSLDDPEQIANLQEDAKEILLKKNYTDAQNKAKWLLRLKPQDEIGLQTMTLALYHQNRYFDALSYLKQIPALTPELQEVLAISQILGGETNQGQALLEQLLSERSLGKETLLRLGYGFLQIKQPTEAFKWFDIILSDDDEVKVGKLYALSELGNFNDVLSLYDTIGTPYSSLEGVRGVVVEALVNLGKNEQAQVLLNELLEQPQDVKNGQFSEEFTEFKSGFIDKRSRNYIAAIFYENVKQDKAQALDQYKKILEPTSNILLKRAEIKYALKDNEGALIDLNALISKGKGYSEDPVIQRQAYSLIAEIYADKGYHAESADYLKKYFSLGPKGATQRALYASVFVKLRRYDLAAEQMDALKQERSLSVDEQIVYLDIYTHRGLLDKVNSLALEFLKTNKNLTVTQALQLGRIVFVAQNQTLLQHILKAIPSKEKLSVQEKISLIELLTLIGDYHRSVAIADVSRASLEETTQGLMALARLELRLSHPQAALKFAYKALDLDPLNEHALRFLLVHDPKLEDLKKQAQDIQQKIASGKTKTKDLLQYAQGNIDLAIEAKFAGPNEESNANVNLQKALAVLEEIVDRDPPLPEAYYLLGQVQFLLDRNFEAVEAYQKALELDPSFNDAHKYLALAYLDQDNTQSAIETLKQAVLFAPDDSESWQQLARLLQKQGKANEALSAWEKVVKQLPNQESGYLHLAKVQLELNQPLKAEETLQVALRIFPKNVSLLKLLIVALHSPQMKVSTDNQSKLAQKQNEAYEKLRNVDPKQADAVQKEYNR